MTKIGSEYSFRKNRKLLMQIRGTRYTASIFIMLMILTASSCNFNMTDIPGPQVSSTIESSKSHDAFICAYKVNGNRINGSLVNSIFAEKKYWLNEGFFGRFDINCCESQLVIVYDSSHESVPFNDVPKNWQIIHSDIIVKYYESVVFPDTIHMQVRLNVKDSSVVNDIALYKIQGNG